MRRRGTILSPAVLAAAFGALALILTGCPNPITADILSKQKDLLGPHVAITAPADGSSYPATVVVTGSVSDIADASGALGKVTGLRYDLTPATIPGADVTSALGTNGAFSFQFPTAAFSGTMVLTVTATDWNGNSASTSITLVNQGAVPSFTTAAGNHQVTLTWNPVPLSQSYSIYYTTNGSIPSPTNGTPLDNVTSPLNIGGLSNGSLCVFLLQSHSSSGADNWSTTVQAIPLSTRTLTPRIQGQYGQIRLEWSAIPAAVGFEVWRSVTRGAGSANISGTVSGTSWSDSSVNSGQVYYYQVRPALAGATASEAAGGQTVDFPNALVARVGFSNPPGQLARVAVQGTYAYAASLFSYKGLQVFDISDPRHPVFTSEVSFGVDCYAIAVKGSFAYVGDLGGNLHVVNISDPTNPLVVGSPIATRGQVLGAAISGSYLYLACGDAERFDISDPALPGSPVWYSNGDSANGIAVSGAYVYVAFGGSLRILNASTMAQAGFLAGMAWARDIAVSGTRAYIADGNGNTLWVIDVSTPASPVSLTGAPFPLGIGPESIAVRGSTVCVSGAYSVGGAPFKMVNVQNPAAPKIIAGIALPTWGDGIAISGDYAFVGAMGFGLQVVDIRNASAPLPSGSGGFLRASAVAFDADRALATGYGGELVVYDVSNPALPVTLGTYTTAPTIYGVAPSGRYAVLVKSGSLEMVDVSNPALPLLVGTCPLNGFPSGIAVKGDYAYVAGFGAGMEVVDISDPQHPSLVGVGLTQSTAISVGLQGSYVFVGEMGTPSAFEVFDVSNPLQPVRVGSCNIPDQVNDLLVSGSSAYLAVGNTIGLAVVDVSNPRLPVLSGTTSLINGGSVALAGDCVLLGDGASGTLRVVNVSNPGSLQLVGQAAIPDVAVKVQVGGTVAFVADFNSGFRTLTLW